MPHIITCPVCCGRSHTDTECSRCDSTGEVIQLVKADHENLVTLAGCVVTALEAYRNALKECGWQRSVERLEQEQIRPWKVTQDQHKFDSKDLFPE